MKPLEELQREFAAGVATGMPGGVLSEIAPSAFAPARLVGIYRNHFLVTLEDAVAATFPAVRALVGPGFFGQVARSFILTTPPKSPCLSEYGAAFSGFLAYLPDAQDLPYLADVARLEWALNRAYHAPDVAPLALDKLAGIEQEQYTRLRFAVHPAVQLVASRYPLSAIWQAAQPAAAVEKPIDLDQGGEALLVTRDGDDVAFQRIDPGPYRFLHALIDRATVAAAARDARAAAPDFDLSATLQALFDIEAFTDRTVVPNPKQGAAP